MALAPCRGCGQTVTYEDLTCPHCGAESPATAPGRGSGGQQGADFLRQGVAFVVIAVLVLSLLAFCSSPGWDATVRQIGEFLPG